MDISTMDGLSNMTFSDLQMLKTDLDTLRRRILALQNAQCTLLNLPGEIRNMIFLYAMRAELFESISICRQKPDFKEPAFFTASRQIRAECTGVWYSDVVLWQEYHPEDGEWRVLEMEEVVHIRLAKSKAGRRTLVTQPNHTTMARMRESVETSNSVCPRRGIVGLKEEAEGTAMTGMKWWVW